MQTRGINTMMHNRPIQSPLKNPDRILDIGCGTGAMCLHLAKAHQSAWSIIGVDLSDVDMPQSQKPTNVSFIQGNFKDLAASHPDLAANSFDFVFSRMLVFGMTDWPGYIAQAVSLLKPGAWLELQDVDIMAYNEDRTLRSKSWEWHRNQQQAFSALGLDIEVGSKLEGYMQAAGLVDVQVTEYRWVFGHWEGHPETDLIGEYSPKHIHEVNGSAYRKIFASKMSEAELEEDIRQMGEDLKGKGGGMFIPFYVVSGRKPA